VYWYTAVVVLAVFAGVFRSRQMQEMLTDAVDDPGRLSVCLLMASRGFAVQTWLNGSRSCLWWDPRNIVLSGNHVFDAASCSVLVMLYLFVGMYQIGGLDYSAEYE